MTQEDVADGKMQILGSLSELELNSSAETSAGLSNGSDFLFSQDDSIFELPLKDKYNLKGSNFSELNEVFDSVHMPVLGHPSKKVRFEDGEVREEAEVDGSGSSTSVSQDAREIEKDLHKPHNEVENLLERANAFNEYVGDNLDRMNSMSSEMLAPPRINSQGRMGSEGRSDSISGFALSDSEYDADSVLERVSSQTTNDPFTHSNILSQLGGTYLSDDIGNSPYAGISNNFLDSGNNSSNDTINDQEEFEIQVPEIFKPKGVKKSDIEDTWSVLLSKYECSNELFEIPVEDALQNYLDTLDKLLEYSKDDSKCINVMEDNPNYHTFSMKSAPSIEYQRFVQRIQSKCMFGSIIYLGATYLLQILFLTREEHAGPLRLKRRLHENEIHRVIIGTIRISTKLLEDFVHSHEYICKVCGISKKLMTKLELALLFCLKDENLLVNSEKLMATKFILDDLRAHN
ncbi:PHO85 cyclin-10 [Nakaseomyces bracarensis]|uniref:PHO85 cyclin-10 n=1 Tax=Nakaseomyces bracarensis TaxID=273131 RepID=A0ABR4NM31_9SACH